MRLGELKRRWELWSEISGDNGSQFGGDYMEDKSEDRKSGDGKSGGKWRYMGDDLEGAALLGQSYDNQNVHAKSTVPTHSLSPLSHVTFTHQPTPAPTLASTAYALALTTYLSIPILLLLEHYTKKLLQLYFLPRYNALCIPIPMSPTLLEQLCHKLTITQKG